MISTDAEKAFEKSNSLSWLKKKKLKKSRDRKKKFNMKNPLLDPWGRKESDTTEQLNWTEHHSKWWKTECFPSKIRKKTRLPASITSIHMSVEVPAKN